MLQTEISWYDSCTSVQSTLSFVQKQLSHRKKFNKEKSHFRLLLKDKTHKEQYNKSSFNRFIKFIYTKQ